MESKFQTGDLVWFNENASWYGQYPSYPGIVLSRRYTGCYLVAVDKELDPDYKLRNFLQLKDIDDTYFQLETASDYLTPRLDETIDYNVDLSNLL